jgi:hypothetical protein
MNKQHFKFLALTIIITSVFFYSCDTVNDIFGNDAEPETGTLTAEKQSIVPGEVVAIDADFELESGKVTGYIDTEEISLDIVNNSIYFMAPDLFPGSYEINLTLNDIEYSVQINILSANEISDPAVYIENAQSLGTELVDISIELDMLMEESGIIDSVQVNENLLAIQNSLNKTNQVFSQMTMDEKAEFARIYSANEYWINEFQQIFVSTSKSSQCEYLLEQGNNAKNAGNVFEARDHFLKYKLCKIDYYANNRLVYYLNKFNKLIDELSNDNNKSTVAVGIIPAAFAIAFVYFVWTRFEADLRAMNNNPLAEELVDQKLSVETYNNNQKTNYSKRVRFRAVDQNDINRQDLFGKFVGMIHDANEAIKKLLGIVSDADIEPVTLSNSSQTIDFNRNFVIQNISNSNVKLKSTAFVDDMWEVVFETSETEDQEFTYDLIYDDGQSNLTKTINANLISDQELTVLEKLINWGPWRTQNFMTETSLMYAVFNWNGPGSGCYCLQLSYYFANSGTLEDSFPLCFTQYSNEYTYAVNDDEPCPPDLNNPVDYEIMTIISISQDTLLINDDGEIWTCTPYSNK